MNHLIAFGLLAVCLFSGCSSSDSPAAGSSSCTSGTDRRLFITSTQHDGSFGGLSGADSFCQARATAASLTGTWIAYLATSSATAASRLPTVTTWKLIDGTTVFSSTATLTTALVNVTMNEGGTVTGGGNVAFTGASVSGGIGTAGQCTDWTSNSASVTADIGLADWSTSADPATDWQAHAVSTCNTARNIYCFECK